MIDKYSPFGNEKLLPRGTLREPPKNLKRASYIFITKCDGSSNEELIQRIRKYNRTAEIIECAHEPKYLENIDTNERLPLDHLKGKEIGTISGIAVPESFEDGIKNLGAKILTPDEVRNKLNLFIRVVFFGISYLILRNINSNRTCRSWICVT